MGDAHRESGQSLGSGQGDQGGREIVLRDGELMRSRPEVGKHGKGGQPAQRAGHPTPTGSVDQARTDDAQPASPGRQLRGELGPTVELTGPRIRRHRRQRDGPSNPTGHGLVEQRDCAEDVRLPDVGPAGQRHVVGTMDEQVDTIEGIGRTDRVQVEEDGRCSLGPGTEPGDGPCTRPIRRRRRGPNPDSRWRR